jgi:Uma2 family endonuclease
MVTVTTTTPRRASTPVPDKKGADPGKGDILYEIVDNQIVEKPPMGAYECRVATLLGSYLEVFARTNGIGRVLGETLFDLRPAVSQERRPDLALVSFDRWPRHRRVPSSSSWGVVPDLAVEVISTSNLATEVMAKLEEYFKAGVVRVWVIYPDQFRIYDYDSPSSVRILGRGQSVDGGALLPGFQLALTDLFEEDSVAE